jgi:arginyl-tRNA synthetase
MTLRSPSRSRCGLKTACPSEAHKDGEWTDFPMMVRKSDGASNCATTDIATPEFRRREWNADAAWYVVDYRQSLHFQQLFAVAERLGLGDMDLRHNAFGTILGTDGVLKKAFPSEAHQGAAVSEPPKRMGSR